MKERKIERTTQVIEQQPVYIITLFTYLHAHNSRYLCCYCSLIKLPIGIMLCLFKFLAIRFWYNASSATTSVSLVKVDRVFLTCLARIIFLYMDLFEDNLWHIPDNKFD